jgi:hypothetical protein
MRTVTAHRRRWSRAALAAIAVLLAASAAFAQGDASEAG